MKAIAAMAVLTGALTCLGAEQAELRGRVICLLEERNGAQPATNHAHVYGFKTAEKDWKLVRAKFSEALFVDKRLHERELLLKGKVLADGLSFEPITIRSIKDGVVHDLYYYCEICAIESVAPEICVCCQGPVELVEKPLRL
ncbi:MAG: hypothetical protein L0Y58_18645 [Verrucomicrobia subdivision 3 bacterium]|nr:hypothetical protein [Limisphaerales bacterium]